MIHDDEWGSWMVIEQEGGLIQNIERDSGLEVVIVQVDYDELSDGVPEDALAYYRDRLEFIREVIPPGEYRRHLRIAMTRALGPRDLRAKFPRKMSGIGHE